LPKPPEKKVEKFNPDDAPEGMVAVASATCIGCDLMAEEDECFSARCAERERKDGYPVIFKRKANNRSDAIARIQAQMLEHGICVAELDMVKPEVVRYADGTGNTWSGDGFIPNWMLIAYGNECFRRSCAGEPCIDKNDFAERYLVIGAECPQSN